MKPYARVTYLDLPWQDEDEDGYFDRHAFRQALPALGLTSSQCADVLYDTFDADGSGRMTLEELQRQLHPPGEYEHAGRTSWKNSIEPLDELAGQGRQSTVAGVQALGQSAVQAKSELPLVDQIKQALAGGLGRVLDVFREWDEIGFTASTWLPPPRAPWTCLRSQLSNPRCVAQVRLNHQARLPPRAAAARSAPLLA